MKLNFFMNIYMVLVYKVYEILSMALVKPVMFIAICYFLFKCSLIYHLNFHHIKNTVRSYIVFRLCLYDERWMSNG